MSKKNKADSHGFVFSTDPDFKFERESAEEQETLQPHKQRLRVRLDTRHRGGKAVTLVTGFVGSEAHLESMGKRLKSFCGTGGSVKDREVIIQGDQRQKVLQWLKKEGFGVSG